MSDLGKCFDEFDTTILDLVLGQKMDGTRVQCSKIQMEENKACLSIKSFANINLIGQETIQDETELELEKKRGISRGASLVRDF